MPESLRQLIQSVLAMRCETQTIEVKAASQGAPRVYDTLSSFSNQEEGGAIIFGIDENRGFELCGVYDAQELQKSIVEQCREMEPSLHPVIQAGEYDGKTVVVAHVRGLMMGDRPAYRWTAGMLKGAFVRVGDADEHMTDTELYEINAFKEGISDDVSVHPDATSSMLGADSVARYVIAARTDRPRLASRSNDDVLNLTGVMRDGAPTLAGMMALGDYPQQLYRNCRITAVAVEGEHMGLGDNGRRFLDNRTIEGSISQMMEEAWAFVARNVRISSVVRGLKRTAEPEYPEVAVREMIANALVHRDYGPYAIGTPVRLAIYSNRIECTNPGGIYGGSSIAALGRESLPTRNPTLISLLEITHDVENRHSGIPAMRDAMRSSGLREPVFSERRGTFTCTLYGARAQEGGTPVLDEARILEFCIEPRTKEEIARELSLQVETVRRTRILPLVRSGKLALTMPDAPRSKNQRYVTVR